jgi:hypothetical protein
MLQNMDNGIELLVHNLSHSDLVLGLNTKNLSVKSDAVIARPKFSHFSSISESILKKLKSFKPTEDLITKTKLGSRSASSMNPERCVSVGYDFKRDPIAVDNVSSLRFRKEDQSLLLQNNIAEHATESDCFIERAYFPLLAVLLPKWLDSISSEDSSKAKVVVLVSGRGTPTVPSDGNTAKDNSTKFTGELMQLFIQLTHPEVHVVLLHSDSNLFRYDENIFFVKMQLLPMINAYRDRLVELKGADWKDFMRVTLSFADGSSARISAINASLKYYRPAYMHFWQLKSFWREQLVRRTLVLGLQCSVFLYCFLFVFRHE